jgi:UDP-N-acetylglucosamine 4-epimerase
MNLLALTVGNSEALNQIYNTAFGERTTLNELVEQLKKNLATFDPKIAEIHAVYGEERNGDIPHSLASVDKAKKLMGYAPKYDINDGLREAISWYWENLKQKQ